MTRRAPLLLPHGLDDLQHGVDYLLTDCPTESRQRTADRIVAELAGIGGTAAAHLAQAVQTFAAFGGDGTDVHEAFLRFAVDAGAYIGARNQGIKTQSTGARKRAEAATSATDAAIEVAMTAAINSRLGRRFDTVQDAINYLARRGMPAGLSESKLRRRLPEHPHAAEWVSTLPKSRR